MSARRILFAVPLLALALAACSGGDARPTADELADTLASSGLAAGEDVDADLIRCWATGMVDSDLPDDLLRKLADNAEYQPSDEETAEITEVMTSVATTCA